MKATEKLQLIKKGNLYKPINHIYLRMFPSDPTGSLDDFFLKKLLNFGGKV